MAAMSAAGSYGARLARSAAAVFAALVVACTAASPAFAQAVAPDEWPMAGHDPAHTATADGPLPPYRTAWRASIGMGGPVSGPVVAGGAVIVVAARGVVALDAATGAVRWQVARALGPASMPAIAEGLVIHTSGAADDATVVCRRLEDGAVQWETPAGSAVSAPPTVADGVVLVGTSGGRLLALELETGERRWSLDVAGGIETTPAVSGGIAVGTAYEGRARESTVHAVDVASGPGDDGRPLWRGTSPGPAGAPAVAEGAVHLVTGQGRVVALDLRTGAERWSELGRDLAGRSQIPAAGSDLVVADRSHLSLRDRATGVERWTHPLANGRMLPTGRADSLLSSSPAVVGETVLIGGTAGRMSALRLSDGHRVWSAAFGSLPISPVAASGAGVYVATLGARGEVVALENDPSGRLVDEVSPTVLFPLRAVGAFTLAALATGAALLLVVGFVLRPRPGRAANGGRA